MMRTTMMRTTMMRTKTMRAVGLLALISVIVVGASVVHAQDAAPPATPPAADASTDASTGMMTMAMGDGSAADPSGDAADAAAGDQEASEQSEVTPDEDTTATDDTTDTTGASSDASDATEDSSAAEATTTTVMSVTEGGSPSGWSTVSSSAILEQQVTVYKSPDGKYGLLFAAGDGIADFAAVHIHTYNGSTTDASPDGVGPISRWICGSPEWDGGVAQNAVGANAPCCRNWACNLLGVNNPGENDGQVPPCSDFQPGTTYWITDDHEYLCSPDTCGGDGVFGVPGKGAFVIHGGSFQRWLLPAPQDNATSDSACGLTNDAPGPDVLGFQVLS